MAGSDQVQLMHALKIAAWMVSARKRHGAVDQRANPDQASAL